MNGLFQVVPTSTVVTRQTPISLGWKNIFYKGVYGRVRTKVYRGYLLGKYLTEVFGKVRYGLNTLPNTPVKFDTASIPYRTSVWFGTNSTPVPDTSARVCRGCLPYRRGSVRPQYRAKHSGIVRYELDTGARHFAKLGTTSLPVPDTSVSSVRPRYPHPTLR